VGLITDNVVINLLCVSVCVCMYGLIHRDWPSTRSMISLQIMAAILLLAGSPQYCAPAFIAINCRLVKQAAQLSVACYIARLYDLRCFPSCFDEFKFGHVCPPRVQHTACNHTVTAGVPADE